MAKQKKDRRFKPRGRIDSPPALSVAASAFEHRADEILAVYEAKKTSARGGSPFEAKEGYLKRKAYELICEYLAAPGRSGTIKSIVRLWRREPRSPPFSENPFFWGLLALDPQGDVLNPARLHLYSRQLLYAHRHEVPPHYLIGFLYQSGNPGDLSFKVARNLREDWFAERSNRTFKGEDPAIAARLTLKTEVSLGDGSQ